MAAGSARPGTHCPPVRVSEPQVAGAALRRAFPHGIGCCRPSGPVMDALRGPGRRKQCLRCLGVCRLALAGSGRPE
eukprot:7742174-Heterocapsa_arctica.AAC.1